ncbi:methyltransferase [Mycobacteroides franklinii]|uniref:Methyltransferase n=1 Tax=Mycobacteroides franklinii TaxID=948102 RepID=A0A1S1LD09_9MYCO|nr:class I SAM-dependent methyltransferase [Mycobacteroides franklinii]OHU30832.1 methyltransferase [Mycobacteroides franklinii]
MAAIDARHLDGVSETALITLRQRAVEAARPDGVIDDPMAVVVYESLDYDYHHFGRTHQGIALRALTFDNVSNEYLADHPRATVVALAEGLQTSFWRIDNGELNWLTVDLEPIVRLRRQLLPPSDRVRYVAQSALDHTWMDQVDDSHGVLITAEGLFMYLERDVVFDLIAACAKRFPGGWIVFDTIPWLMSVYSRRRGWKLSEHYTVPPMPFSFTANQYDELRALEGVHTVREVRMPPGRGTLMKLATPLFYDLPFSNRMRPAMTVVEFG